MKGLDWTGMLKHIFILSKTFLWVISQLNMTVLEFYDGYVVNYFLAGFCNVPDSLAQQPRTIYCRAAFLMF